MELNQRAEAARKRLNNNGLHTNEQIIGFYKGLYGSTHGTYNQVDHVLDGKETDQLVVDRLEDMADQVERHGLEKICRIQSCQNPSQIPGGLCSSHANAAFESEE